MMDRVELARLVKEKAAEIVPNLDLNSLDGSRSLKDYGASSLDLVEIVSTSMRQLKVKVPRSELNKIGTIDGLIDLLYRAVEQKGVGA
jgi:acyl carrier protein